MDINRELTRNYFACISNEVIITKVIMRLNVICNEMQNNMGETVDVIWMSLIP
jgi:hypothetical protein